MSQHASKMQSAIQAAEAAPEAQRGPLIVAAIDAFFSWVESLPQVSGNVIFLNGAKLANTFLDSIFGSVGP